jgi:hypothetical protein
MRESEPTMTSLPAHSFAIRTILMCWKAHLSSLFYRSTSVVEPVHASSTPDQELVRERASVTNSRNLIDRMRFARDRCLSETRLVLR